MKIILSTVVIFFTVAVQVGLLDPLVGNFFILNLPLVIIIFINWAHPDRNSLLISVVLAWAVAYFSIMNFIILIYSYTATAAWGQYLSLNKLSNRNLISLLVTGLIVSVVYHALLLVAGMAGGEILPALSLMVFSISSVIAHLVFLLLLLTLMKFTIFKYETKEIKVGF